MADVLQGALYSCAWIISFAIDIFWSNPLLGPLANLVAVPFFGLLITPLVLMGILTLNIFKPAGETLLKLADFLIDSFWHFLNGLLSYPMQPFRGACHRLEYLLSVYWVLLFC